VAVRPLSLGGFGAPARPDCYASRNYRRTRSGDIYLDGTRVVGGGTVHDGRAVPVGAADRTRWT